MLSRLERTFGRFAIPNLSWVIVGGMAVAFVLGLLKPEFTGALELDLPRIQHGEYWRLFTYLFLPPVTSPIFMLFALMLTFTYATSLENSIGSFRFNLFWLVGMIGTTVAAALTHAAVGNAWLLMSLFIAFCTVFPDYTILLMLILPVRVKWLGLLGAAFMTYEFIEGSWPLRGAILASFANYFLFFGQSLYYALRGRARAARGPVFMRVSAPPRVSSPPPSSSEAAPAMGQRSCAICGAKEEDGTDIRVCSCAKCGGKVRNLCLAHARNH